MEQGKTEKKIIETCYKERLPLPDRIRDAPQLFLGLEIYYGAFFDLTTSRGGFGDGPISWKTIEEYARLNDFSEDQKDDLHYYIAKMDETFMEKRRRDKRS